MSLNHSLRHYVYVGFNAKIHLHALYSFVCVSHKYAIKYLNVQTLWLVRLTNEIRFISMVSERGWTKTFIIRLPCINIAKPLLSEVVITNIKHLFHLIFVPLGSISGKIRISRKYCMNIVQSPRNNTPHLHVTVPSKEKIWKNLLEDSTIPII